LHLGGIADVIERREYIEGADTRILTVIPVLLGLRHPLVSPFNGAALRPYIAFGGGPYWIGDVFVRERYYDSQEVAIASKLHAGGYAGGGLEFMLSSNFGLNFDVKHHFVNFNVNDEHSGYEFGMGLQFYWGDYKPARRE
jgi:outer membrane protein W